MSAPGEPLLSAGRRGRRFRAATAPFMAAVLMALLSIEFLLGTYLNLYVTIPTGGVGAMDTGGLIVLILHIVVGIMVIGTAGRLAYVASKARDRLQTILSMIAALGVVLAFLAGADFTFSGQADASSFTMAFGFFLGMLCSALIAGRAHLPRPDDASTTDTASR